MYIFIENYSYFNIANYPRFFTRNLLCLDAHLNGLSLDDHLISKQPQWQCHVTMTGKWGHVSKQMLNLAGWVQIRTDQSE